MADKTFEGVLLEKHGALMSIEALAELLDTTPRKISNGFANNLPWCRQFKPARIKIGRRVYLNTLMVASILLSSQDASAFDLDVRHNVVAQVWAPLRTRLRVRVLWLCAILYRAWSMRSFWIQPAKNIGGAAAVDMLGDRVVLARASRFDALPLC